MFKFNDEFVSTKIDELVGLNIERYFIDNDQIEKVKRILDLEGNTSDELTAKRNSVVKLISDIQDQYYRVDWGKFDELQYTISGVTAVIDRVLYSIGCLY